MVVCIVLLINCWVRLVMCLKWVLVVLVLILLVLLVLIVRLILNHWRRLRRLRKEVYMKGRPVRTPGHARRPVVNTYKDHKKFSRTADRMHPVNAVRGVMRGGVRL